MTSPLALGDAILHTHDVTCLPWPVETGSVHTVVTSPPFYGLRDYGMPGQLGQESVLDCAGWATGVSCGACYVCRLVAVFTEVRRVLRDDGTVWVNMGDSFSAGKPRSAETLKRGGKINDPGQSKTRCAIPPKNLLMVPSRFALAMQADGWYLRSAITWCKVSPMPESVTDRPTSATEMIYLFSKRERYFYDMDACRPSMARGSCGSRFDIGKTAVSQSGCSTLPREDNPNGRNLWNYWTDIRPTAYTGEHYAAFPESLPKRCLSLGTSERGCCAACGAPHVRIVNRVPSTSKDCPKMQAAHEVRGGTGTPVGTVGKSGSGRINGYTETLDWQPSCSCNAETVPCTVLDCFSGAGTTGVAALSLGRRYVGLEINPEYVAMSARRLKPYADQGVLSL